VTRTLDPPHYEQSSPININIYTYVTPRIYGIFLRICGFNGLRNPDRIAVVEVFNNKSAYMTIVNFSVPDDVKADFDKTFGGQNKSAAIADLMRKAVADAKLRKCRVNIFRTLTQRRSERPSLSDAQTRASRTAGRS
jgi:hypothetical protein